MGKTVTATELLRVGRRTTADPEPAPETRRLEDTAASGLVDEAPGGLGVESTSTPGDSASRRLGAGSANTYERITVFLTAEQKKWLKGTARALPVDGLSASDIVRLAVSRLREDLHAGLPLVEALSHQAHVEVTAYPGRRNRGLPPRE